MECAVYFVREVWPLEVTTQLRRVINTASDADSIIPNAPSADTLVPGYI